MSRLVPHQSLFGHKAFVTNGTLERPVSCMCPYVDFQVSFVRKPLLTHKACIRPCLHDICLFTDFIAFIFFRLGLYLGDMLLCVTSNKLGM